MGTAKRERKKANRAAKIEREIRQERVASVKRRTLRWGGVVVGGIAIVVIIAAIGGAFSGDDTASTTTVAPTDSTDTGTDTSTDSTTDAEWPGDPADCPPADGSATPQRSFDTYPPKCITDGATYTAEIVTNKGSLTVSLDAEKAPKAVNSFVTLARYSYFDATECHRIIPGFVVQGGDAVGPSPGVGGPGYEFADELPTEGPPFYQLGSVAMANSGPDTNGSQFFVVTGDSGVQLPAQYSLFGQVTDGMDVVMAIEAAGSADGTPTEEIVIESISVTQV